MIERHLKAIALFNSCTPEEIHRISFTSTVKGYRAGELIIKEGELADALYIVLSGAAVVLTRDNNGKRVELARIEEDNYFGEQGYLNNLVRTASVKAGTDLQVIEVSYETLAPVFKRTEKLKEFIQKASLGRSIANLQTQLVSIDAYVKKDMFTRSERTRIQYYEKNDVIFKKNDPAHDVYFIASGAVELAFTNGEAATETVILDRYHIFGEVGVIKKAPRSATAKAVTTTSVIVIPGEDFLTAVNHAMGLRTLVAAFSGVYALPRHEAIVEQYIGQFEGEEAIYTKYRTHTGKAVMCAKVVEQPIFSMMVVDALSDKTLEVAADKGKHRTVLLHGNQVVGIHVLGEWDELHQYCEWLLDERTGFLPL